MSYRYGKAAGSERLVRWVLGSGVAIGLVATNTLYAVDGGQRAVIFDKIRGVLPLTSGEGLHFKMPWIQNAILFDIRSRPRIITTTTGSKDMQTISLSLRVLHRPEVEALPKIYSKLGLDYDERVLPSIGNEVLKSIIAQFDAGELITQRETVSRRIREDLVKRAKEFHILLEDVAITHLTFGVEFTKAVEAKQVAQQDAERARFMVEKSEQEKNAAIIKAGAEAHAAKILSDAMESAGTGFVELRRIEAAKDIASTLSSNKNVSYIPGGPGSNNLLNLGSL